MHAAEWLVLAATVALIAWALAEIDASRLKP